MFGVRLTWNDVNDSEQGHRIYRSTSPMNPGNMPVPMAMLGPNVTSYDDMNVSEGETYYYRVSAYQRKMEMISDEISIIVTVPIE
jgi:fibronectin type 3 domain-containing protein